MATTELDKARAAAATASKKVHLLELTEKPHGFYFTGVDSKHTDMRLLFVCESEKQTDSVLNPDAPIMGKVVLGVTTVSFMLPITCNVSVPYEEGAMGATVAFKEMKRTTLSSIKPYWVFSKVFLSPKLVECAHKEVLAQATATAFMNAMSKPWEEFINSDDVKAALAMFAMRNGDQDEDAGCFVAEKVLLTIAFSCVIEAAPPGIDTVDYATVNTMITDKKGAALEPTATLNHDIVSRSDDDNAFISTNNIKAVVLAQL